MLAYLRRHRHDNNGSTRTAAVSCSSYLPSSHCQPTMSAFCRCNSLFSKKMLVLLILYFKTVTRYCQRQLRTTTMAAAAIPKVLSVWWGSANAPGAPFQEPTTTLAHTSAPNLMNCTANVGIGIFQNLLPDFLIGKASATAGMIGLLKIDNDRQTLQLDTSVSWLSAVSSKT